MATQKEKLIKATQMAMRIKSVASRLRHDAIDYDVRFPLSYADNMERMANDFLKMK
mgnify:CR=1 FL=1